MSSFLFGFALVLLVSLGARDQQLLARLSGKTGPGALAAGILAALLSAAAMAAAGAWIAAMLFPGAKQMLVALALAAAAVELAWPVRLRGPREPTHSVFATFLVVLARQVGDAARFLVFALAAATALPWHVAAGGAAGSALALALGWSLGARLEAALPLRVIRWFLAALAGLAAIWLALSVRGMV